MANIKSAKKRILVNQTKADRNKAIRSAVKTSMKKVDAAVAANDKEAAAAALVNAISTIDKAASKGVYHKNNAARGETDPRGRRYLRHHNRIQIHFLRSYFIAIPENNAKNSAPQSVNYCVTDFRRTPVRLQICSLQFALSSTAFFALFSGLAIENSALTPPCCIS